MHRVYVWLFTRLRALLGITSAQAVDPVWRHRVLSMLEHPGYGLSFTVEEKAWVKAILDEDGVFAEQWHYRFKSDYYKWVGTKEKQWKDAHPFYQVTKTLYALLRPRCEMGGGIGTQLHHKSYQAIGRELRMPELMMRLSGEWHEAVSAGRRIDAQDRKFTIMFEQNMDYTAGLKQQLHEVKQRVERLENKRGGF